jgi:WD40 repeat protein
VEAGSTDTTPLGRHIGPVRSVAFGPEGSALASGGDDGMVRLWDTHAGGLRVEFGGRAGAVRSVAFTPDGAILASGGDDRTVQLWDVVRGEQILTAVAPMTVPPS